MSALHPIISVTGSSGAGTTTVKHTFEQIFRREGIRGATIDGDAFTYDETTVVEHQKHPAIVLHTDRNTLKRTSWEA